MAAARMRAVNQRVRRASPGYSATAVTTWKSHSSKLLREISFSFFAGNPSTMCKDPDKIIKFISFYCIRVVKETLN